jgi:hypothetical protein
LTDVLFEVCELSLKLKSQIKETVDQVKFTHQLVRHAHIIRQFAERLVVLLWRIQNQYTHVTLDAEFFGEVILRFTRKEHDGIVSTRPISYHCDHEQHNASTVGRTI